MRVKNQRGFTMLELLVSLTIFGVITGFLMASFRTGRSVDELRIASESAASAVRQAQTRALSGSTVSICRGGAGEGKICSTGAAEGCTGGMCSNEVPRGYGVRFSRIGDAATRVIIFADIDGTKSYSTDEALQEIVLSPSKNVAVTRIEPFTDSFVDIIFVPPRPTTYFNNSVNQTVVTVTLGHEITGQERGIRVNRLSGQVSND